MNCRIYSRIAVLTVLLYTAQAATFTGFTPQEAPAGATVELTGSGFEPGATVSLNGVNQQMISRAPDKLVFQIAPGSGSGLFAVTQGGQTETNFSQFTTLRMLNGRFELPPGRSIQGYELTIDASDPVLQPDGTFVAPAPIDSITTIWAVRQASDPAFIAVVTPDLTEIRLNARSTAEALVLNTPGVKRNDPEFVAAQRARLGQIPETQMLADMIASIVGSGRDYMQDARVKDLWQRTATALLTPVAPALVYQPKLARNFEPNTPRGTKLKYLNPPPGTAGYGDLHSLNATLTAPDEHLPNAYRLKLEGYRTFPQLVNPLDWIVETYELDPNQFTDGFNSVDALTYQSTPLKKRVDPDDTAVIPAALRSKYFDILDVVVGLATDYIFSHTFNHLFDTGPDEVALPATRPGVYVTEVYSGNMFWGTSLFRAPGFQRDLIDQLHRRPAYGSALVGNIVIAAVDVASIVVPLNKILNKPSDVQDVIYGVVQDVSKAMTSHGDHPLRIETLYDLLKTSAGSLAKNALAKLASEATSVTRRTNRLTKGLEFIASGLDIFAKISAGGQALERSGGLIINGILAVERNVVVIGDPFGPAIDSFEPPGGHGGETLLIHGRNFSAVAANLKVQFVDIASTDDPNSINKSLPLTVIASTPTSIAVRVPANAFGEFPRGFAYVAVEVTGKPGLATTFALPAPNQQFFFIPPPSITSILPSPTIAGGVLEIRGQGFDGEGRERLRVLVDDGQIFANVISISGNRVIASLPAFITPGTHQVKIEWDDTDTENFPIAVVEPRYLKAGQSGRGMDIIISKADMSNVADGQISVYEAVAIATGTLDRTIEEHDPCEFLPPEDPLACAPRKREVDWISNVDVARGAGLLTADYVHLNSGLQKVITGFRTLPPLTSGDRYSFGAIIINGNGSAQPGLVLDGVSEVFVSDLVLKNFTGNGVEIKGGAALNQLNHLRVEDGGATGLLLSDTAQYNVVTGFSVSNVVTHGVHLTGANVTANRIEASGGFNQDFTRIEKAQGNGIRIDNSAHHNFISPGTVRENGAAGILITGPDTDFNFVGRVSDELFRLYDIVKNNGPGVHLTAGVNGTILRYIAAGGNHGDGILLEGRDCSSNQIDRPFIGMNYYESQTDPTLPNEGSGIHLRDGAHHNLIGTHTVNFGVTGTISGNRDDGILLEGADTAYNTINQQWIGLAEVIFNPFQLRFGGNGKSGIRIRQGSHHNRIGDSHSDLANVFFDAREAALVIENIGSSDNVVFGNQFGAMHNQFSTATGLNRIGIWIRDQANANIIGKPGGQLIVGNPQFPTATFQFWNVIARSSEAGILIESAAGQVGTDNQLTRPNVIQSNKIGEEDNGNLARNVTGIKIGAGAYANVIGGLTPAHGNRINGQSKYGLWIENNHITSPHLRNRIENNYIAETTGPIIYNDYINTTPPAGIGLFVQNSSGQVIGEGIGSRNEFRFNRTGAYFENSSGNTFQANLVTNQFIAGVVVRGGERNIIGNAHPQFANEITAFGLREAGPQAGVTLTHTKQNKVLGNLIGHIAPGRGGIGVLVNNARDNEIGGAGNKAGNVIVNNTTNGVVLTGSETFGNGLFNNYIGVDRNFAALPNAGHGVEVTLGAYNNQIGGSASVRGPFGPLQVQTRNYIIGNQGAGVAINGPDTVGNTILNNRITANAGRGIEHRNGGNHLIPPPTLLTADSKTVTGNVPDLAKIPPGSTIQVFNDPDPVDPEGDAWIGEAIVGADGSWRANLFGRGGKPTEKISMTATHPLHRSTSEFGTGAPIAYGLRVARTDGVLTQTISAGATRSPVFRLSLTAINTDVDVRSLAIDTGGSLPDAASISGAKLFNDLDRDGLVTLADEPISGPEQFTADNGRITFAVTNQIVEAGAPEWWILAFDLAAGAPSGSEFTLSVTNAEAVDAELLYPPGTAITATGEFSIDSANFTVSAGPVGQTLAAWKSRVFSAAQLADPNISGNNADPDLDGVVNILEYAFNLNPLVSDRDVSSETSGIPRASRTSNGNEEVLTVTFVRRGAPVDLVYTAQVTEDLNSNAWTEILNNPTLATTTVTQTTVEGALLEKVVVRLVRPIRGLNELPAQFVRVRVEQAL